MNIHSGLDRGDDEAEVVAPESGAPRAEQSHDPDRSRRSEKTKKILIEADRRDEEATARDVVSDEREKVADRLAFTNTDEVYPGHGERRAAASDRASAKNDRESSADDRARLTEDDGDEKPGSASGGTSADPEL